jgi:hypothetical protein
MAIMSAHEKFFRSSRTFHAPQKVVDHIPRTRNGEGKWLACPRPKDHTAAGNCLSAMLTKTELSRESSSETLG